MEKMKCPNCNGDKLEEIKTHIYQCSCGAHYSAGYIKGFWDGVCKIRQAEAKISKLRSALAGLVGVDGEEELERMEAMIRSIDAPAKDKAVTIDAIHALMESA
jgi:hypothetical protein